MKKILFASTALVATASVAAAEITFSGYGRFGMRYVEDQDQNTGNNDADDAFIESRFRLNIDVSTESDAGVNFGARVRVQADDDGEGNANSAGFNGARFHAETGGFRLEVGNVAHALDNMANFYGYEPGLVGAVGQYGNYGGPNYGYSSTGDGVNGVSAIYSVGDFRAQLTYDQDTDNGNGNDDETYSGSLAYTWSGWTFAVGYEHTDDGQGDKDHGTVLTIGGSLGVADVALFVGEADDRDISYGVSGRYDISAATGILASVANGGDHDDGTDDRDTSFGIGFDHDLGGGVALRGMVGRNTDKKTVADLGVLFNF